MALEVFSAEHLFQCSIFVPLLNEFLLACVTLQIFFNILLMRNNLYLYTTLQIWVTYIETE